MDKTAKITKANPPDPSVSHEPSSSDHSLIRPLDYVIFYDKCKNLVRGIAKWIGPSNSDGTTNVEIELVSNTAT